jgi:D-glycero-alpha-D-manno-heptose 1-phosphate guanylyltransferase
MECIILAGGLGTRLRGVVSDAPKCMAPINGSPFLAYVLQYLAAQHATRAVLSLGYKHEVVTEWLNTTSLPFPIDYVIEREPLGTGGGLQLAMHEATEKDVVVLNGDTLFQTDLRAQAVFHKDTGASATLALKELLHIERYGIVNISANGRITSFEEKKYRNKGLINGGVYIINKEKFLSKNLPERFSFEKDYLEQFVDADDFYGIVSEAYFIDIGIPEDYAQAQDDFKTLFA